MERDDAILHYLQDRMSLKDREAFEAEMDRDASLAAEVEVMRSVREALATTSVHPLKDDVWDRVSRSIDGLGQPANTNRRPWGALLRYAAVAVVAVSTWQVAIVPQLGRAPDTFRPASQASADFVVQVRFSDTAAFAEITELLYAMRGTIIDGPGALGLVQLSFTDDNARAQAIVVLEGSDLVEFAQSQ